MKYFLIALLAFSFCCTANAQKFSKYGSDAEQMNVGELQQTSVVQEREETAGRIKLRQGVVRAARSSFQKGEITRREFNRVRLATLLPSVMDQVEDAAIMQINASGEDTGDIFEVDGDGRINRASIDWDKLSEFLEKMLPIILQIISIFAGL